MEPKANIVYSLRSTHKKVKKIVETKCRNKKAKRLHHHTWEGVHIAPCQAASSEHKSPSSAGADEAASMPVSGGASTARDGAGAEAGRAHGVGTASSLPSASAACSKLSDERASCRGRDEGRR